MEDPYFDFIQPNFSFWPLYNTSKSVLLDEEKWQNFFLSDPISLILFLNSINFKIKKVNFFDYYQETNLFFRFLKDLVKSKPRNIYVLQEFNGIIADIVSKLSVVKRFNKKQEKVALDYLKLLELMFTPSCRYLIEKMDINRWMNDFEKMTTNPFSSSAFLSQFRKTLLLSFQSSAFIKKYPVLIRMIGQLAHSLDKTRIDTNELEAIKLFDLLGVLDHLLKTKQMAKLPERRQNNLSRQIKNARHLIYMEFEPYIERNFLKFIFFKAYLTQSYIHSTNLTDVCNSDRYHMQCKSDYLRFKDTYFCASGLFPKFRITIKNNNYSKLNLDKWCVDMRQAEQRFMTWMEGSVGLKPSYKMSLYTLYLSDFKRNFLVDKLIFERDDRQEDNQAHNLPMAYFLSKKNQKFNLLMGSTYAYTTNPFDHTHGYMYHLCGLFEKYSLDLSLVEGLAELYSRGICSERSIEDLRIFVNDTYIFELFKKRQSLFYFYSLKWVGYLVNERPELLKKWIIASKNNNNETFYLTIDRFIENTSNIEVFVNWSRQQVSVCNAYLNVFSNEHRPPMIYLTAIKHALNQTETIQTSHRHNEMMTFLNQSYDFEMSGHHRTLNLVDVPETKQTNERFKQQLERGFPLPLGAFVAGFISGCFDNVSILYQEKSPFFSTSLKFGFKPFISALISSDLNVLLFDEGQTLQEKVNTLIFYFSFNFLAVFYGESLNKKLFERIQNKALCFFVPLLTWTLLWNPGFFFSEERELFSTLFLQLLQGFSFKLGGEAYGYAKNITRFSSLWHKSQPKMTENNELSNNIEMRIKSNP